MKLQTDPNKLEVYTESRKRRIYVGELVFLPEREQFRFKYDSKYKSSAAAIPIGPELDLFPKEHISKGKKLFPSFADRIPSRSNPAYEDYCRAVGILPTEKNPIVLLTTIGRKGPSTFVFEPVEIPTFTGVNIVQFRDQLELSRYDFSEAFGLNELTVQRIEKGNVEGSSAVFRLIEVFLNFPEVALWQLSRSGKKVSGQVSVRLQEYFSDQLKSRKERKQDKSNDRSRD